MDEQEQNIPKRKSHPIFEEMKQDAKLKNDDLNNYQKRDGILTIFIILQMGFSLLGIFGLCQALSGLSAFNSSIYLGYASRMQFIIYANIFIFLLSFICALGLWFWQDWGYKGLILLYFLSICLGLFTSNLLPIMLNIGTILFLEAALKNKKHWLD